MCMYSVFLKGRENYVVNKTPSLSDSAIFFLGQILMMSFLRALFWNMLEAMTKMINAGNSFQFFNLEYENRAD